MKTTHFTKIMIVTAMALASCAACGKNEETTPVEPSKPTTPTVKKENRTPWRETGMTDSRYAYIANNSVQIGVDLGRGGGIFHFSTRKEKTNLLNHADEGRFIQQSYYGNDGSDYWWTSNKWSWNPIQGGGSDGTPATVTKKQLTDSTMLVVTKPKQWGRTGSPDGPCVDADDCVMKESITLKDNYAILDFTFTYNGTVDLGSRSQEVPAFFCDYDLNYFVFYGGDKPWTGDKVTRTKPGVLNGISNPNSSIKSTENWFAYVDNKNKGIGLYVPGTTIGIYYVAGSGPGGPTSGSCSYFAPIRSLHIKPGYTLNYKAYLMIGTYDEMRETFKKIRDEEGYK